MGLFHTVTEINDDLVKERKFSHPFDHFMAPLRVFPFGIL